MAFKCNYICVLQVLPYPRHDLDADLVKLCWLNGPQVSQLKQACKTAFSILILYQHLFIWRSDVDILKGPLPIISYRFQ